jgi:hypothetical protein
MQLHDANLVSDRETAHEQSLRKPDDLDGYLQSFPGSQYSCLSRLCLTNCHKLVALSDRSILEPLQPEMLTIRCLLFSSQSGYCPDNTDVLGLLELYCSHGKSSTKIVRDRLKECGGRHLQM